MSYVNNVYGDTRSSLTIYRPEDYGAVGNGTTDDSTAFTNCISAIVAAGNGILWLKGVTYKLNSLFTIDMGSVNEIEGNGALLDFSGASSTGAALTLYVTTANGYKNNRYSVNNLGVKGVTTASHTGIALGDTTAGHFAEGIRFNGVEIFNFATGLTWGNNSWGQAFYGCDIHDCTNIASFGSPTNSGERLYFNGCAFFNSTNGLDLSGAISSVFEGCSFDYNTNYNLKSNDASLTDCYCETNTDGDYLFTTGGTNLNSYVSIMITNLTVNWAGARTKAIGFGHEGTSGIIVDGLSVVNLANFTGSNLFAGVYNLQRSTVGQAAPQAQGIDVNGDLMIWQQLTSFPSVATGKFTADCWEWFQQTTSAVCSVGQNSSVPSVGSVGRLLPWSMKIQCTTADTATNVNNALFTRLRVEGYRWAAIAQQPFTLQYWLQANKTGTVCVALRNSGQDRSYVVESTIAAASTWQRFNYSIPASPSSGTWDYTTGRGVSVSFCMIAGSVFQNVAGSWVSGNFTQTINQTNYVSSVVDYLQIAGVKLLPSTCNNAVSRSYQEELALCQRYYEKTPSYGTYGSNNVGSTGALYSPTVYASLGFTEPSVTWNFKVPKRTTPTITTLNCYGGTAGQWSTINGVSALANATVTLTTENSCLITNGGTAAGSFNNWVINAVASSVIP